MFEALPLQTTALSPYDPLTVSLILLAAGAVVAGIYLYRETEAHPEDPDRRTFAWLFGLIGFFSLLISGELIWANWAGFPAAQYTELFGVAQTLYAIVMLSAGFVLYWDLDPRPFTWVTAISGLILLQGGRAIGTFGLTKAPLLSTGIWLASGGAAILLLPAAYVSADSDARNYLLYLVVLLLVVTAVLSGFTGLEAHYGHIAEAATSG